MSGTIPGRQPRCGGSHKGALWLGLFIYMDGSLSYDNGTHKTGYRVVAYRKATEISSEKGPLSEFVEAYNTEMKALEAASYMIHNIIINDNSLPIENHHIHQQHRSYPMNIPR